MKLESEYNSLRSEILQLYAEQSHLTYVTTISSAVAIWGLYQTDTPIALGVMLWQVILIGVCWKLRSNYCRLYRLCTYIKVVHEQKLIKGYVPEQDDIGWITRSRTIGKIPNKYWLWASGAKLDSKFLRILSFGCLMLVLVNIYHTQLIDVKNLLCVIINAILCSIVFYYTKQIYKSSEIAEWFEQELFRNYGEHPDT